MNDLLDLPPIEAAALAEPKADLQPLDLRKINLTDVALAQYGDWQKDVAATKANLSTLVLDLSTPTKIKEARSLRQRLIGEPLAAVRKVAAGIKSAMATTSKAVGAELEKIEAAYSEADALILPRIEAREAELEAERAEKARIEAERVAKLQAGIATIRGYVQKAAGLPAERIANGVKALELMHFGDEWQEFAGQVRAARDEALEALRRMHAAAVQAEADRAERERMAAALALIEAQQADAARLAAERAAEEARERDRLEKIALAQAAMPPATQNTVTTPGGIVADASTGEVLHTPEPAPDPAASVHVDTCEPPAPVAQPTLEQKLLQVAHEHPVHVDTKDDPAVKLGDLNARLGFTMTEAFVRSLKVKPLDNKGRAVLIAEASLPDLRDELIARIREVLG